MYKCGADFVIKYVTFLDCYIYYKIKLTENELFKKSCRVAKGVNLLSDYCY